MSFFDIAAKSHKIAELEAMSSEGSFWDEPLKAQKTIEQLNNLKSVVDTSSALHKLLADLAETLSLLNEEDDQEIHAIFESDYREMENKFSAFEVELMLSHECDHSNAIIEIHPGAGGTESCDWAEMLYRMYSRWADKKGFKVQVLDYQSGDEAGIKAVTFLVEGDKAYGYLKVEKGVHRLVRISPFDSGARRHTSFASIEVMPQFNDEIIIDIKSEDLIVETKRASGAGGQHINKTDSAIRMVHKPTGLVANCQNGRSQHENREEALRVLKSRIYQRMIEEHEAKLLAVKGEVKANEWGSQIRSYVFHPYSMIKDHRSGYERNDVDKVMDGDIDGFIYAFLKMQIV